MITGFNTDIEHDGVVYHVQTEDKGLDTPMILSLVYAGGAILASKRARYEDLIASGFSDEALTERLTRQHKLICAAIHAGRIEDLKRMSAPSTNGATEPVTERAAETPAEPPAPDFQLEILRGNEEREAAYTAQLERQAALEAEAQAQAQIANDADLTVEEKIPQSNLDDTISEFAATGNLSRSTQELRRESVMGEFPQIANGLRITLLGKQQFRSGESPNLKVMVGYRTGSHERPVAKAAVSVKVLGTTFRPQLYSAKTQSDGVAAIATKIPTFTSGRAAILIRAVFEGDETELRRVILPS